jgi:predicted HD superfamily hydrolase involved in NAD metabolism
MNETTTEMNSLEQRLRAAVEALPRSLRDHVLRVEVEADRLGRRYDVDLDRVRLAALGHDLVRHKSESELLDLATEYDVDTDPVERAAPILVHGPIAAKILVRDYDYADAEVLAGIDCHTTARPGMTMLEKVLFIADKIEPEKLRRSPAWREVGDLAQRDDIDVAILRFLDLRIEEAVADHLPIHQRMLDARNALVLAQSAGHPGWYQTSRGYLT